MDRGRIQPLFVIFNVIITWFCTRCIVNVSVMLTARKTKLTDWNVQMFSKTHCSHWVVSTLWIVPTCMSMDQLTHRANLASSRAATNQTIRPGGMSRRATHRAHARNAIVAIKIGGHEIMKYPVRFRRLSGPGAFKAVSPIAYNANVGIADRQMSRAHTPSKSFLEN